MIPPMMKMVNPSWMAVAQSIPVEIFSQGTPMAKMDGQIDDAVKQSRVDELMLTQQDVAFAKAKGMTGKSIEVLIDRPAGRDEEDGYVARSQSQAPDIDSCVFVNGNGTELHPGQLLNVRVTDYQNYDLVAEVPRKRSRSLTVVSR